MEINSVAKNIIDKVIKNDEGGWVYTNNSHDLGGATYAGVTRKWFIKWYNKKYGEDRGFENINMFIETFSDKELAVYNQDLIYEFYYDEFYAPINGDNLPLDLILPVFSCAVNVGLDEAPHWLQFSVNDYYKRSRLIVDGKIGPKTISVLRGIEYYNKLINIFILDHWIPKYLHRVVQNSGQLPNLKGWYNRARKYVVLTD